MARQWTFSGLRPAWDAPAVLARIDISRVEAAKEDYAWRWGMVTIALAALAAALVGWRLARRVPNCRGKGV